ncbi:hypothetical protein [uncultured Helicobacter sp.]|uniref:hypothetical protein n=1 Tax=uncultured Helicobacter sp. TaxID=175537 RepID=UPI0026073CAF|nr:hypothetical protein [uncultured Helicobacter sp.]
MQNATITTLTNNANATINSNATNGRFGAIDLNSNARIDNLINAGRIDNTTHNVKNLKNSILALLFTLCEKCKTSLRISHIQD